MKRLIHYLTHIKLADRLPPLPRMYSTDFDMRALSDDEVTLLKMSAVRSPHGVEIARRRKGAANTSALIASLPTQHSPRRGNRFMPLMRRIFGVTAYDPLRKISYQHRKRRR